MLSVTPSAPALFRLNSRASRGAVAAAIVAVIASAAVPAHALESAAAPGDTVVVDFAYAPSGDQYEWVVPDGVTEVTIELAAGSGASVVGATGGPGGHITALVSVTPGQTLLVLIGAAGSTTPRMNGGEGSAVATASGDLLVVAGGGGAAYRCGVLGIANEVCSSGGAGGYSALSGTASGRQEMPVLYPSAASTAATQSGRGQSIPIVLNGSPEGGLNPASPHPAAVVAGVIIVAPPTLPLELSSPFAGLTGGAGGGGGGYYAGGHGGIEYDPSSDPQLVVLRGGGGGGGSGFLTSGATQLSLDNNVGNGFASISYVVPAGPEPEPAPELAATGAVDGLGTAGLVALALTLVGAVFMGRGRRPENVT